VAMHRTEYHQILPICLKDDSSRNKVTYTNY